MPWISYQKSQPICPIAEVETDMHSNIFLQELKQEVSEGKAALGMETGAGCGSLRVDQCTHSVWLLTLSLPHSARSLLATSEVELMISFSDNSSGKYTVRSNASPLGQLFNVLLQHKMSIAKRRSLFLSGACACKRERFVLTERASVLCVFVPFHFLLGS